jgi:hypothetical protein
MVAQKKIRPTMAEWQKKRHCALYSAQPRYTHEKLPVTKIDLPILAALHVATYCKNVATGKAKRRYKHLPGCGMKMLFF